MVISYTTRLDAAAVTKVDIDQAKSRLLAADPQFDQLSVPAQRMLATAHAITHTLRAATGLDWSVAIIALCKAVEVEAGRCISQPLKDAVVGLDLRQDVNDRDFSRVARFCAGTSPPPELGSLIYFLRAAASSSQRADSSPLVGALRTLARQWPNGDWLFADDGFLHAGQTLSRNYRNPAAHTALLSEDQFARCAALVQAPDGLLARLMAATSPAKNPQR